ncbi:MAG TPA: DUF4280 domain-containing protein [Candidatus Ventrousia excrementavium]|uniref:DUF4280 domain-containing protein n=1 Tax=Candidatus Ventrousia excrementavium TaxID=2840961 RepID=A0A9D1LM97_9CLOT|nr:DUF4280 domain-containing protein [Candidatus Ventrousia excrementavium]
MANQVCMGAMCQCSFGAAPSTLVVTPENKTLTSSMPAATIMDNVPMKNIMPFGMCSSLANPTVAAATSAALGVLTPMPCVPVIAAPWAPGCPTVLIANKPALNDSSKLMCNWGGVISINNAGQMKHQIP